MKIITEHNGLAIQLQLDFDIIIFQKLELELNKCRITWNGIRNVDFEVVNASLDSDLQSIPRSRNSSITFVVCQFDIECALCLFVLTTRSQLHTRTLHLDRGYTI